MIRNIYKLLSSQRASFKATSNTTKKASINCSLLPFPPFLYAHTCRSRYDLRTHPQKYQHLPLP
jgi:hypothetical protein